MPFHVILLVLSFVLPRVVRAGGVRAGGAGAVTLDPKTQAYIWRFLLGLLITEIPILTLELSKPEPDWRLLAIGLLGGLGAFLEKAVSPQLSTPGVETSRRGQA